MGEMNGTVVVGGNIRGDSLNQLNIPTYVFVDRDHSVYVSDSSNNRAMKWVKDAKEGIVVAGGRGEESAEPPLEFFLVTPQGYSFLNPILIKK
jgi:hypothetical protein